MSEPNPTSSNSRKHGGAAPRQGRDRRYALITGTTFGLGFGLLALAMGLAIWRYLPTPSDPDSRTGSIMVTTNGQCRQTFFDNDSAQVSNAGGPCNGGAPLSKIGPPMKGREGRIDAITKSFNSK
jgi:hypothetical protein